MKSIQLIKKSFYRNARQILLSYPIILAFLNSVKLSVINTFASSLQDEKYD